MHQCEPRTPLGYTWTTSACPGATSTNQKSVRLRQRAYRQTIAFPLEDERPLLLHDRAERPRWNIVDGSKAFRCSKGQQASTIITVSSKTGSPPRHHHHRSHLPVLTTISTAYNVLSSVPGYNEGLFHLTSKKKGRPRRRVILFPSFLSEHPTTLLVGEVLLLTSTLDHTLCVRACVVPLVTSHYSTVLQYCTAKVGISSAGAVAIHHGHPSDATQEPRSRLTPSSVSVLYRSFGTFASCPFTESRRLLDCSQYIHCELRSSSTFARCLLTVYHRTQRRLISFARSRLA